MCSKQFISRKAAVFSDIHSNYYAFKACCEDALSLGADMFIFLGDFVSDLSDPREVLDLLYGIMEKYPTVCLRGNRERYMLDHAKGNSRFAAGSKTGSLLYTFQQLRSEDVAFFDRLPIYDQIVWNGIRFEIAHASKEDDRFFFEGSDERTERVLAHMDCPYMLAGHSHKQFLRQSGGKTILNPGSVGVPRDHGHLTQYAVMEFNGGGIDFHLRQIPYDVRSVIQRQFDSGLVDLAPHWAISVLYNVITGEEYVIELLNRVYAHIRGDEGAVYNEDLWHRMAAEMGMKFTRQEILDLYAFGSNAKLTSAKEN